MDQGSIEQLRRMLPQVPDWKREQAERLLENPATITAEQVLRLREANDVPPLHEMRANEFVALLAEMAWRACNPVRNEQADAGGTIAAHSKSDSFEVRDFLLGRVAAWERNALGENVEQLNPPSDEQMRQAFAILLPGGTKQTTS